MSRTPRSAMEVMAHLGELSVELDKLVAQIGEEDKVATVLREQYIVAYSRAYRNTQGTAESRKQASLGLTTEERLAAEMADCTVRDMRRRIDAMKVRIDVGRSYGSAIKAEVELTKSTFSPYGS